MRAPNLAAWTLGLGLLATGLAAAAVPASAPAWVPIVLSAAAVVVLGAAFIGAQRSATRPETLLLERVVSPGLDAGPSLDRAIVHALAPRPAAPVGQVAPEPDPTAPWSPTATDLPAATSPEAMPPAVVSPAAVSPAAPSALAARGATVEAQVDEVIAARARLARPRRGARRPTSRHLKAGTAPRRPGRPRGFSRSRATNGGISRTR